MANKYYYLVASLPYLKFAEETAMSSGDFLAECGKWLTPEETRMINGVKLEYREAHPDDITVLKEWREFDTALREELMLARSAEKTGGDYKVSDKLKNVLEQENPLLMEKTLERVRWDYLEEKEANYFFDLNRLILYSLKVQLLERLARFNKDKGESYFYELCEVNYEQAIR